MYLFDVFTLENVRNYTPNHAIHLNIWAEWYKNHREEA